MRATAILLQQRLRLTLFTRPNCSLCDDAKEVINYVGKRRPFEYEEIDVMEKQQQKWKALYEFDTPVLHVDAPEKQQQPFETTTNARKLMHRFTQTELEQAITQALQSSGQ
ncbi:glutaredoxin-like domain-containing protein [Neohortaea acidophila]|uniref:Glutaredoxin-like protein n=1 Tax=Neohortaea acidophila TaxID=245834 RepID=A0A6A6Q4K9_9PEZI|nr:glutaredoxin-like domain-containing protein [Neohortaea acidophila]KAF2486924.1 glutaredoxin-like domain-containing protein [Neohortaea acidophila]